MDIIVIGGGAAGMLASIVAARNGNSVKLFEKNNKLGKKLFLTGKGRCNLTNACDVEELFNNVVNNSKFLYSSIYDFDNSETMKFFEELGLPLKIERGNRVFPLSDHSSDVIKSLEHEMKIQKVEINLDTEVVSLIAEKVNDEIATVSDANDDAKGKKKKKKKCFEYSVKGVLLGNGNIVYADKIIMATGGESYASTGSDGKSFDMLSKLGIKLVDRRPSLVPLCVKEQYVCDLSGLSLKNVSCTLYCDDRIMYNGFGEMLFTHFGVSGPLILSASSHLKKDCDFKNVRLVIDLKPALSMDELDARVLRDFTSIQNKQFKNSLNQLLPSSLIAPVIKLSGIDSNKQINSVSKEERLKLCEIIKNLTLTVTGDRGFNEAIITRGGVSVSDINPSTLESKTVKGLYFAGEMIDVDALTGGFNLQIAWSTAHLAAN